MNKPKWLDRGMSLPGPYLTLCLSEQEFKDVLKSIKFNTHTRWIKTDRANATTHFIVNECGDATCIVCLRDFYNRDPVEVAGLLVHEAVHIWQEYAQSIGEEHPGWEQEAYAIQSISQQLMAEFSRRMV